MDFINLFISFSGRINRAKFWIAVIVFAAINLIMAMAVYFADQSTAAQIVNGIVSIAVLISSIAVGIKRLHDRNKSGLWLLLFFGAPTVLFFAGIVYGIMDSGSSVVASALGLLALAICLWSLIELGCLRGTIGQNKYGADPLAPEVLTPPIRTHA